MKKQFFLATLFAVAFGLVLTTHYACKKETTVKAMSDQQFVSAPATTTDRGGGCFDCPGNMGCLIFSTTPYPVTLDIFGFAKDPEIEVPCGQPLRGAGLIGLTSSFIDPSYHYGFKPLCDITLPFRFGLRNNQINPVTITINMQTRTSNDEYCSSQLTTTLLPGIIKSYRIFENQEGQCVFTEETCSTTE